MKKFYAKYFNWKEVFVFSITTFISIVAVYFVPQINRFIIDEIAVNKKPINIAIAVLVTTVCLFVVHLYLLYFPNFFGSINQCRVEKRIRSDLVKKYLSIPNYKYKEYDKTFLLNLFLTDTFNAAATLINYKVSRIVSSFQFIVFFAFVIFANWKLGLISLMFIPLYFIAILLSQKNLHKLSADKQEKNDKYVGITNSLINGKAQINISNSEPFFIEKQAESMNAFFSARLKSEFVYCVLQRIPVFVQAVTPIIILIFGASFVQQGKLTIGTLVMFVQYVGMMFEPIGGFAQLLAQKNLNVPTFERLSKVLFDETEVKNLPVTQAVLGKSKIANIDIYTDTEKFLFSIDDITFDETGLYCIKGENGTGKTTFINLLCLLYNPDCFRKSNSNSVFEISENFASKSYLYHPHFLFPGTVKENILLGKNIGDEHLKQLCRVLNFENFLDNEVTTQPVNLSDGEQQKLCLIRTLLQNTQTIILDEPEKSLDAVSIHNLHELLIELKREHLVIIITHTETFDKDASAILKIHDKKMVAEYNA